MSGLIDKRKRSREDDLCDSPLSKRINNLHLTNFDESTQNGNNNSKDLHAMAIPVKHPALEIDHTHPAYSPELDESQNPFYYVKNKLLHELHLERLKRCTI